MDFFRELRENRRLEQELAEITRKYRALDGGWGDMEQACDNLTEEIGRLRTELAEARAENERLREAMKDLTLACAEAARTLEVVDPNAPSLEQADAALGKHIRYTGPIMRAEATRDETP